MGGGSTTIGASSAGAGITIGAGGATSSSGMTIICSVEDPDAVIV